MAEILAVDDEKEILQIIKGALERVGHRVTVYDNPVQVMQKKTFHWDLILLDVMMPGIDGFELCREIRDRVDCPILFLTAKTLETDLMTGLSLGGDDYIMKPFGIGELRARVDAHLRRESREKHNVFALGGIRLLAASREMYGGEEKIALTKSEYEICEFLMKHHGQVFSKEHILESVFGFDKDSEYSIITEHIKNIRNKFSKAGYSPVETVWGIGYKWIG